MTTPDQPTHATGTPRTDAESGDPYSVCLMNDRAERHDQQGRERFGLTYTPEVVNADFARTLERELQDANARALAAEARADAAEGKCLKLTEFSTGLTARLETEKQKNLDHAEDWAFCGIPLDSIKAQALVLRDQNRILSAELAALRDRTAKLTN